MAERLLEVEAALPEIFEAFDATDSFVIAERRKWRALDQLRKGWRLGGYPGGVADREER